MNWKFKSLIFIMFILYGCSVNNDSVITPNNESTTTNNLTITPPFQLNSITRRSNYSMNGYYDFDSIKNPSDIHTFRSGFGLGTPLIFDNVIYTNYDGSLYAFDLKKNIILWNTDGYIENIDSIMPVISGDYMYIVIDKNKLIAIDKNNGKLIKKFKEVSDIFPRQPIVDDGKIFLLGVGGIICIDATTGNKLWDYTQDIISFPSLNNDLLYIISQIKNNQNEIHAISKQNGQIKWRYKLKEEVSYGMGFEDEPVIGDNAVYYNSGGHIYSINTVSGELIWEKSGNFYKGELYVDNEYIYTNYSANEGGIFFENIVSIDKNTGDIVWEYPRAIIQGITKDSIYIIENPERSSAFDEDTENRIVSLAKDGSTKLWSIQIPSYITSQISINDIGLFFTTSTGNISYILEKDTTLFPNDMRVYENTESMEYVEVSNKRLINRNITFVEGKDIFINRDDECSVSLWNIRDGSLIRRQYYCMNRLTGRVIKCLHVNVEIDEMAICIGNNRVIVSRFSDGTILRKNISLKNLKTPLLEYQYPITQKEL